MNRFSVAEAKQRLYHAFFLPLLPLLKELQLRTLVSQPARPHDILHLI